MKVEKAQDIQGRVERMVDALGFGHVHSYRIICMRSFGSKSRAHARIWNLPRIWQKAIDVKPYYIIEVVSQNFDKLGAEEQDRVLIHELLHIPKTFSGALVPHACFGKKIDRKSVEEFYKKYKALCSQL